LRHRYPDVMTPTCLLCAAFFLACFLLSWRAWRAFSSPAHLRLVLSAAPGHATPPAADKASLGEVEARSATGGEQGVTRRSAGARNATHWRPDTASLDDILSGGNYSHILYGGPGLVPRTTDPYPEKLRFIWWRLLSEEQKSAVMATQGVCKWKAPTVTDCPGKGRPCRMLFSPLSNLAEPAGAVWYHAHDWKPIPDHAYVEVSHCVKRCVRDKSASWGMWFYVAPGSGVSVNVGRTRVLTEVVVGGTAPSIVKELMRGYDSMQLWHDDKYSPEMRHEIVFSSDSGATKGWDECSSLNLSFPGLKCGSAGHLFDCPADHPPLKWFAKCKHVPPEARVPRTC